MERFESQSHIKPADTHLEIDLDAADIETTIESMEENIDDKELLVWGTKKIRKEMKRIEELMKEMGDERLAALYKKHESSIAGWQKLQEYLKKPEEAPMEEEEVREALGGLREVVIEIEKL
ncbi:MAG: hypothetical protein Q7S15_01800 [bacterium]|nr:hypothetical protein [bacterium]